MKKIGAFITKNQRFLPLTVTAVLSVVAYILGMIFYEGMRDPQVFMNLFRSSPFLLISAIGMTFVMLMGGIDLSVSGVIALTTVASAALLRNGQMNPWLVMLLMLLMGMTFGAVMGFFITYLKVQPFIGTLAGMWFARGLCFFISDDAIPIDNHLYRILAQTKLLIPGLADPVTQKGAFISILAVFMMVVLVIAFFVAHYTRFGRTIYAIGGNEQSARLMGLPVNRTKILVYTLSGFCSALAGIVMSIYVASGHGLYARGFEMDVIAAVVMGGTALTGGSGYMIGTFFGVMITGIIQTLIQFNGTLSSWWTRIVVGFLTLAFIGVQSFFAARQLKQRSDEQAASQSKIAHAASAELLAKNKRKRLMIWLGAAAVVVILSVFTLVYNQNQSAMQAAGVDNNASTACELKPFRQELATQHVEEGAVISLERNGGTNCIDELYSIYPDGRIVGDDGVNKIEKKVTPEEVNQLVAVIEGKGWFTDEMYTTSHVPCGQCFTYFISVTKGDQIKSVKAVDGGTDAPANYWVVVTAINGLVPKFTPAP